jgi:hypothetical protein
LIDAATYPAYLGVERTADTPTFAPATKLTGYIYTLHVYQAAHDHTANTTHAATCSGSTCLTLNFNKFGDGGTDNCDGTNCADVSCVRSGECQTNCAAGFTHCHLCKDRECKKCLNYTTCEEDECLSSGFAESDPDAVTECKC